MIDNNEVLGVIRSALKEKLKTENVYLLSNASETKPYYVIREFELRDYESTEIEFLIEVVVDSGVNSDTDLKRSTKAIKDAFKNPLAIDSGLLFLSVAKQTESGNENEYAWRTLTIQGDLIQEGGNEE